LLLLYFPYLCKAFLSFPEFVLSHRCVDISYFLEINLKMQATRTYWNSLLRNFVIISTWLIGFLIFALIVGPLISGRSAFNPQQVPVTHVTNYTVNNTGYYSNGTAYYYSTNASNQTTTYQDLCDGHQCSWWLNDLVLLLEAISLALFLMAFALSSYGIAAQESLYERADYTRNAGGNRGLEVVAPPGTFIGAMLFIILGLFAVFVAILVEIWVVTGKRSDFFVGSVIILSVYAILAAFALFLTLFRNEAPIVVQEVIMAVPAPATFVNNNAVNYEIEEAPAPTGVNYDTDNDFQNLQAAGNAVPMENLGRRLSNLVMQAVSPRQQGQTYSPLRSRAVPVPRNPY